VSDLTLGTRAADALAKAGVVTVGQIMDRLNQGEDKLLEIDGFGRKALIDLKKRLRQLGYEVPESAEETSAA
jgi:large subunit ribosomal protein L31